LLCLLAKRSKYIR